MTNITIEDALKSKSNFQEYLENNPTPSEIVDIVSLYPRAKDKWLCKITELTQNIETFLNLFDPTNQNVLQEQEYIVWTITNEKEKIMKFVEKINNTNSNFGIFVFKAKQEESNLKFECLAKPILKKKPKKNLNSPAALLQKEYWQKYFEVCDEVQSEMQIPRDFKVQHFQTISIGKSGVLIMQTINSVENYVATELFINSDKTIFEQLLNFKSEIEAELGELDWQEKEGVKSTRIRKTMPFKISDSKNHAPACLIQIKSAEDFVTTFSKYL